jgi:fucose 4-O-acetylase-like acetyltransferase
MKGIGILLVVLSHSIVKHDPTIVPTFSNGLFNVISSFFMPMFFAVSGYLVYNKVGNLEWVKKHTIKWLLPIAIFTLFYWVYNQYFPNIMYFFGLDKLDFVTYTMRMIAYGFGGSVIWFLWAFII